MIKRSKGKKLHKVVSQLPISTRENEKEKEENILTKSILEWNKSSKNSIVTLAHSAMMLNEKDIEPYKDMSNANSSQLMEKSNSGFKEKTLYNPYGQNKDKTLKNGNTEDDNLYENNERDLLKDLAKLGPSQDGENTFIGQNQELDFSVIRKEEESFMAKGMNFGDISKINLEATLNSSILRDQIRQGREANDQQEDMIFDPQNPKGFGKILEED